VIISSGVVQSFHTFSTGAFTVAAIVIFVFCFCSIC
jgi:hypothetical protein